MGDDEHILELELLVTTSVIISRIARIKNVDDLSLELPAVVTTTRVSLWIHESKRRL